MAKPPPEMRVLAARSRVGGAIFWLVGRWWVGPLAAACLVFGLWVALTPIGVARGGFHSAMVLLPRSPEFGEPRVLDEDASWDEQQAIFDGLMGRVVSVRWMQATRKYHFVTTLARRSSTSASLSLVTPDGNNYAVYDDASGYPSMNPALIVTPAERVLIAEALESSTNPRDHPLGRLLRDGPWQHLRIDWVGVGALISLVLAPPVLLCWLWVMPGRLVRGARAARRSARLRRAQCPRCRYTIDVLSLARDVWFCPECGARGEGVPTSPSASPPAG